MIFIYKFGFKTFGRCYYTSPVLKQTPKKPNEIEIQINTILIGF